MTNEEAIKRIKKMISVTIKSNNREHISNSTKKQRNAMDAIAGNMAIEALEKQMPMKPFETYDESIKKKLFDLIYKIDELSAYPNIEELRKLHYKNIDWIKEKTLTSEYYSYYVEQLKEQK